MQGPTLTSRQQPGSDHVEINELDHNQTGSSVGDDAQIQVVAGASLSL